MKNLILANIVAIVVIVMIVFAFINSPQKETFAQDSKPNVKPQKKFRIAVVNFSVIMNEAADIQMLKDVIKLINDIGQKTAQDIEKKSKNVLQNMKDLEEDGDIDTIDSQDYIDLEKKYIDFAAKYSSLKDVFEFRAKSAMVMYSKKFLNKVLGKIRTYSDGRFDIVYKIVNPTSKELEKMTDVMQLDIIKTKNILFYDKSLITNITRNIIRLMNIDKDKDVWKSLKNKINELKKEQENLKK